MKKILVVAALIAFAWTSSANGQTARLNPSAWIEPVWTQMTFSAQTPDTALKWMQAYVNGVTIGFDNAPTQTVRGKTFIVPFVPQVRGVIKAWAHICNDSRGIWTDTVTVLVIDSTDFHKIYFQKIDGNYNLVAFAMRDTVKIYPPWDSVSYATTTTTFPSSRVVLPKGSLIYSSSIPRPGSVKITYGVPSHK